MQEWHDESERPRLELDKKARAEFTFHSDADAQLKKLRIELHEIRERCAALEVERNMLSAAKLDMAQEIGRLKVCKPLWHLPSFSLLPPLRACVR